MTSRMRAMKIMRKLQPLTELGLIEPEDASEAVLAYMGGDSEVLRGLMTDAKDSESKYHRLFESVLQEMA